jgi:hypothetical protein
MSNNSLQNLDNYRTDFTHNTTEIFVKYVSLITEYLIQCVESIYMRNATYYKYIICKGIDTISHVFKILLLYTRNLDLTYIHCQKSFYYYVEFIGQIGDDNHTFLQLNSKDASLFVYKKTIFEINNEYRKEFGSEIGSCPVTTNIDLLIGMYNRTAGAVINEHDFQIDDKQSILRDMEQQLNKVTQHLLNAALGSSEETYTEKLKLVEQLDENISVSGKAKIPYLEIFARKLRKKNIESDVLRNKLLHKDSIFKIESLTPLRYINWMFAED